MSEPIRDHEGNQRRILKSNNRQSRHEVHFDPAMPHLPIETNLKPHKEARGLRDWQRRGITYSQPKTYADLETMAMQQMAVWEARLEAKRYEEIAWNFGELESGMVEAQSSFNENNQRQDEYNVDELRGHIKARLKLHRAYGIWRDHANESMENIWEAFDKAEIKLNGEWLDTLFKNEDFREQFGMLMKNRKDSKFTDAQMIEELQDGIKLYGAVDPRVAYKRLAHELFTITAASAELNDPNVDNTTEFRGVKKVMNPRRGVYLDRGLSGTIDPIEFALLDTQVKVIDLHNEAGEVVGWEGRRLDGSLKTIGDYLGMHNFWLYLSEYEGGQFWTKQDSKVLEQVIEKHRTDKIYLLDENGNLQLDSSKNPIPVPYPVDAADLELVDWSEVGIKQNDKLVVGEEFETWLDCCRKSEWSRKYVAQDILPNLGAPETMKVIADVAGEVEGIKKDKPLFQRHVAFERKIHLVDMMKSWVAERFIRIVQQSYPRDANLQKTFNQAIYYFGGDAARLRHLYERSFSFQSLNKEPISIAQAASYLRMIYADENPIDFDGYPAFIDENFPDAISLRQVLERAARAYGWQPEPGRPQTFYTWLEEIRDDTRLRDQWTWRTDEKDALYAQLQNNLGMAVAAGNQDEIRQNNNLLILMGRFIEPIYQFSAFQRDYFEFIIRDAIDFFKTDETRLHDRFVQGELIYRAALLSLRRFTPNEPLPGDRFLEMVSGGIVKALPWEGKYAHPADRDATNHPVWLEGDDRRRLWELIFLGTEGYIDMRYVQKGYNLPRHPKTKDLLRPYQLTDNSEDRGQIMEIFERKGRVGQGFLKPDKIAEYRVALHCTAHEVDLHKLWRWVWGVKDETIEATVNPYSQTAKGIVAGFPFIGQYLAKAQDLGLAPVITNIGEVLTYGTVAIPLAGLIFKIFNIPEVTLPGGLLARWGIDLSLLAINVFGSTVTPQLTIVALSAKGILGAVINRKIIQEQIIHRILRAEWFKKSAFGKMSVKESLNVNRNDDVKAILETRGL
ncbi:hypothetical protein HY030_03675 [Candidatus Gottesmanbacteria bacterium]|nr:hypothetical protein [Candidatus Gottesmanbacteria bacterium]